MAFCTSEVQQKLADFADGLDLVPAVRDLARDMCEGRYAQCLKALEIAQPALQLDVRATGRWRPELPMDHRTPESDGSCCAIRCFLNSKSSLYLARPLTTALQVYLGPLVEQLCLEIRRRCMIQSRRRPRATAAHDLAVFSASATLPSTPEHSGHM